VRDRIAALDPVGNVATTESGRRVPFDLASLDIGSLPDMSMPGAREHAIGVKPVDRFVADGVRCASARATGSSRAWPSSAAAPAASR
jgi:NADH dehydrogenase FAD-containing subunit